MIRTRLATLTAAAALVAALAADPAAAQGKGKSEGRGGKAETAQERGGGGRGKGQSAARARGGSNNARARASASGSSSRAERPRLVRSSGGSNRATAKTKSTARSTRTSTSTRTTRTRDLPVVSWDRDYERRGDEAWRWDDERYRRSTRRHRDVPPGWCQGVGNPHNTIANCGYGSNRYDSRYGIYRDDDGIWRDRDTRYGSYAEAHDAFHRHNDRVCRERASQRPFDAAYQLQVRRECSAEHDRWHDRYDPNADPSLIRLRLPF